MAPEASYTFDAVGGVTGEGKKEQRQNYYRQDSESDSARKARIVRFRERLP